MREVLLKLEEWRPSFLDLAFLVIFLIIILYFILDYLKKKKSLSKRQEKILKFIEKRRKISTSQASKLLRISQDTALRELTRLVEMKILERKGSGRNVYYVKR